MEVHKVKGPTMYGMRGLGTQSKKYMTRPENGIVILLYGDYMSTEDETVIELKDFGKVFLTGEIITMLTKKLGIGTLAYPIFFLYDLVRNRWLHPSEKVECSESLGKLLVLRIRCMPSPDAIVKHLFPNDKEYAVYHFLQCRHDFVNDNIKYVKEKQFGREHILGFVVMDLVRYGKGKSLDLRETEALELKHFIPLNAKDLVKGILDKHRLRNNIKPYLKIQTEKYHDYSTFKLMMNFILGLHVYIDGYGMECFDVDKGKKVYVDPYNVQRSGISSFMIDDKEFLHFARIEELVSLTTATRDRDGRVVHSVLLNRMNGSAVDHLFSSADDALSFVSLVNTYYRMMEDYHHMLSIDYTVLKCYILEKLNSVGSHGPVSKKWATDRLLEKNRVDVANNYLLKQTSSDIDTLVLVYISGHGQTTDFFLLEKKEHGYQLNIAGEPAFPSIEELLQYYRRGQQPQVALKKCVRPTGQLDRKVYLCKEDKTPDDLASGEPNQAKTSVSLISEINVIESLGTGNFTEVYSGKWGKDNIAVAVKRLRKEAEGKNTEHLIRTAHKIAFWSHSTIVTIYGICLAPHFSLIMEYGEKGNLEQYLNHLSQKNQSITNYLLIMAAEQLAQAVLYLESHQKASSNLAEKSHWGKVHGNIRTRSIIVFGHEDKLLRIKLGDPGMAHASNKRGLRDAQNAERLPWIAPELYINLENVTKYSDRYAYGITLWEILSRGERPFKYMNADEIERFIQEGNTPLQPKSCPDQIYNLMKRCWKRNPEERISAKEVVRDIINMLQADYSHETYETPKWNQKLSANDERRSFRKSKKLPKAAFTEPINSLANQNGAFESTSAPQMSASSPSSMENEYNHSLAFHSSQGAMGGWESPQCHVSPSTESNISWDSTAPLMGQRSPIQASLASSLAFSSSRDTLNTFLGESADQLNTMPSGIENQVKAKFSLKADLPKTPDMPEPIKPLNRQDLELNMNKKDLKLGEGHYGEVYKGYFKTIMGHPRPVAIKRLKPKMYEKFASEFLTEFNIMIRLQHPNIVEIIGHCPQRDEDNPMLLVMEFVKNGSLKSFLKNNKKLLEISTMIRFSLEIAEGMVYLMKKNIYHRDLAARNVLVTEDRHMKITDFGLAKAIEKDKDYYKMSPEKDFPYQWYAPEALIDKRYNALCDVWSYGITVWEIFSYGDDPNYHKYKVPDIQGLVTFLYKGNRLACPQACPKDIYNDLLTPCWEFESKQRPNFLKISENVKKLHSHYSTEKK